MRIPESIAGPAPGLHATPYGGDEPSGWGVRAALAASSAVLALGLSMLFAGAEEPAGPPQPAARHDAGHVPSAPAGAAADALPPAEPTWLSIPAIDVAAPLLRVGLDPEGWLESPPEEAGDVAGWYDGAPPPGAAGAAVIVGHVDDATGPAVFYGLGALRHGDTMEVTRDDRRTVRFTVYDVAVYDKGHVPEDVYRHAGGAELRVITCGGTFDEATGYSGNVVVFARLTGSR
ncbi:class F sortase [Streptomyces sp. 8K308]|uniref:class F sortase n=1 Tax=Streptomyces sp. 8K308 TaxID=2530388 RepID=UPI00105342A5|nr:class F sortase [Streptomyces sp. 8K308]TDC25021.1 class F sortase [Streptomyces sp. 8K308]